MKIRKQIYELTGADIEQFPVWEYALDEEGEDGQDECTVRPVDPAEGVDLSEGSYSSYWVRARFTLADGTQRLGLVTVSEMPDAVSTKFYGDEERNRKRQPIILTPHGRVGFWFGSCRPNAKDLCDMYAALGTAQPEFIFPITYLTDVSLPCGSVSGRVGGFMFLEDKPNSKDYIVKETR